VARNIEIKARVESLEALERLVAPLATSGPVEIQQDDTFFRCDTGRLKLRAFPHGEGELIYYRRDDRSAPKESFYVRAPTSDAHALREALTLACGEAGRVVKRRTLYLIGRTRVHLDRVEGLGTFMELEVVLEDGEASERGLAVAHELMERLHIARSELVPGAYVDLLRAIG
jgi:predicted adenylyl cyclase CyaB